MSKTRNATVNELNPCRTAPLPARQRLRLWSLCYACVAGISSLALADDTTTTPLKVFILAGQSNMVGTAKIATFDHIGDDPETRPMLAEMRGSDGKPRRVADTWISYYQSSQPNDPAGEGFGQLTAGYGGRKIPSQPGDSIGPEFTFGIYVQKALKQPVLIIKTAWGGKSLYQDFRPPSAGPYKLNEGEVERIKKNGGNLDEEAGKRKQLSGVYYQLMLDHVRRVLKDIQRVCPVYDEEQGYELAGFVWFQGWNDMVNRGVYPRRGEPGGYDAYSELLATFIRDVRKDLGAPKLPFVIGVMGTNGPIENLEPRYQEIHRNFREAMAAPALLSEFKDNVIAVQTSPFWDLEVDRILKKRDRYRQRKRAIENRLKKGEVTKNEAASEFERVEAEAISAAEAATLKRAVSNAAYHYLGSAKIMGRIGKAFAEATLRLQPK